MKNTFHSLAKQDKPALGVYIGDTGACVAEMAAFAGFDYMRIDCEHTLAGTEHLRELIRVADANGLPTLVRVSCLDDITKLLDFGASGILVPDISTADQAREAVRRCKYAPVGERGMTNISRCVRYGAVPLGEYHARANAEVCLAVQIESVEALNNIDEILSVEGIDIVTTGLQDLSQSMGLPGQSGHPSVVEAQDMVIRKTVEKGLYPLITAGTPEQSKKLMEKGVVLQTICFDTAFIMKQFQKLLDSYER